VLPSAVTVRAMVKGHGRARGSKGRVSGLGGRGGLHQGTVGHLKEHIGGSK
jgi:hypothetical protein